MLSAISGAVWSVICEWDIFSPYFHPYKKVVQNFIAICSIVNMASEDETIDQDCIADKWKNKAFMQNTFCCNIAHRAKYFLFLCFEKCETFFCICFINGMKFSSLNWLNIWKNLDFLKDYKTNTMIQRQHITFYSFKVYPVQ